MRFHEIMAEDERPLKRYSIPYVGHLVASAIGANEWENLRPGALLPWGNGYMGGAGYILTMKDGNRVFLDATLEKNTIYLSQISVENRASGLGTLVMEALHKIADEKGWKITVYKVTNQKFFKKFPWLHEKTPGTFITEALNFGRSFEELAQESNSFDEFLLKTDGLDVLYRGHNDSQTDNNSFMTDYLGHAREYSGDDGQIDAFAYNPNDVLFFNDPRFDDFRYACRVTDRQPRALASAYKAALIGNRHAEEFRRSFPLIRHIIDSDQPYSEICGDPSMNDAIIPLMQAYAREKGKNIVAFHGSDYGDYGGQTEYVVADVSKLLDLRKLYATVKGVAP